jgi:hypothetical protein
VECVLVEVSSWLLCVLALLGDQLNTSLVALSWQNSDGLSFISIPPQNLLLISSVCAYLVVGISSVLCTN